MYEELYHTVFRALIYFLQENTAINLLLTGSVLVCSRYRYGLIKSLFARRPAHIVCLYFMEREEHCVQ